MVKVAVVGLGKMGLSHLSMIKAHPQVEVAAVCDSSGYVLSLLQKYTGAHTYSDYAKMLADVDLDAVLIATPSRSHDALVRAAIERDLHVFCEKPFTLDPQQSRGLAESARTRGLVTQVGYHYRFVAAFAEVKRLLDLGAIGVVTHALGEAYGPVVLKPKGSTWRSQRSEGGGALYDYAAHPVDLLSWYLGAPESVGGTALDSIFSKDIEDEVYSTLFYPGGRTAQLSVNWSDESQRKMSTRITLWGTNGRIFADRQECQVFLRDTADPPPGYEPGWNVRYTTDLTAPVWFYVRGEEYSAQLDHFVKRVITRAIDGQNSFDSAAVTDEVLAMMVVDARRLREAVGPRADAGSIAPGTSRTGSGSSGRVRVGDRSAWRGRLRTARRAGASVLSRARSGRLRRRSSNGSAS